MKNKPMREMMIMVTGDIHSNNEETVIKEVASLIEQILPYVSEVLDDGDKIQTACITLVSNFIERLLPNNSKVENATLIKKAFHFLAKECFNTNINFHEVQA